MTRAHFASGAPWESVVGYSRAVRAGPYVHVAGTTAATAEGVVGRDDPHEQTLQALRTIETVLARAGASMSQVVRTRIYVVDIDEWEAIGRAYCAFFGDIRPAATMVEVSRLIDTALRVEIEADAYFGD
jgi:enamine deaminase RidA (YjgF/YER057c/UK114 family)